MEFTGIKIKNHFGSFLLEWSEAYGIGVSKGVEDGCKAFRHVGGHS
jgi:hypothetical protein